jgi:putrescine aminotransferase
MTDEEVGAAYEAHSNPHAAAVLSRLNAGVAVSAHGATVRTSTGRELIDLASAGFGYRHPRVCLQVAEQMRALPLSSRMFFSPPLASFARRLAELTPGDLEVCYPCNSGSEATEGALKLVLGYQRDQRHQRHQRHQRRRIVAATGSYHGATLGALGVCGIAALRRPFRSLPVDATFLPYGDLGALDRIIDEETAGVIVEPVASGAGVRVPPPGYLRALRERCSATGTLLVADEITCGLGRTGRRFAVDEEAVVPDILLLGDALGGGVLPIAAYVTRREVNDRVYGKRDPALHGSTTGGNPAACVAALAALEVIETEGLAARAAAAGERIRAAFGEWRARHGSAILDAAGRGLLAALRLADADTARAVQRRALAGGALVRLDGLAAGEAWIGVRPPLLVDAGELDSGLRTLALALDEVLSP